MIRPSTKHSATINTISISILLVPVLLALVLGCARTVVKHESDNAGGYLSPLEIVAADGGKTLYIAAHTASSIIEYDTSTKRIARTISLPEHPTGLALSRDGGTLFASGGVSDGRVFLIDRKSATVTGEIPVGHTPGTMVVSPGDTMLYVLNRFDNSISVVDMRKKEELLAAPLLREPIAADITPDGRYILVANHLPSGERLYDYVTDGGILMIGSYISTGYFQGSREAYASAGVVLVYDTRYHRLAELISLPNGATDLRGLTISPDGRYAYVTHIIGRYHLPTTQLERGWVSVNAMSIIDIKHLELVNTVLLDDLDHGAANPWGIQCTQDGAYICITHSGTGEVSVIDRYALHERLNAVARGDTVGASTSPSTVQTDLTFLTGIRKRVSLNGKGARGIAVTDGHVYTAEYFSDSIGMFAIDDGVPGAVESIQLGPEKPLTAERAGEIYFHDAGLCFQQWLSCATCHPDGRADALNWDLLNDGIGNPKNTKSLLYSHRTPPVMITGIRDRAETAVRAGFHFIQFTAVDEEIACALDAYLKSLEPVPSPYLENGRESAAAKRGRKVFEKAGCADCHPSPLFTDLASYDVGTGAGVDVGRPFDTPTLVEIWRTKPYLADGRADTMYDVLKNFNQYDIHGFTQKLDAEEIGDLIEYVMSQ